MSWLRDKYRNAKDHAKDLTADKASSKRAGHTRNRSRESNIKVEVQPSLEPKEIGDLYNRAEVSKANIKVLYRSMKTMVEAGTDYSRHVRDFSECTADFAKTYHDQNPQITEAIFKFGETFSKIEDARTQMLEGYAKNFVSPLKSFCKCDIRNALVAKRNDYDKAKQVHDAEKARSKRKTEAFSKEALESELAASDGFAEIEEETRYMLMDIYQRTEVETLSSMCQLMRVSLSYFSSCVEIMKDIEPFQAELERKLDEQKAHINKEKMEREEERLQKIRSKGIGTEATRIFGVPIEKVLKRERRTKEHVPKIVEDISSYIQQNALDEEGIFRLSGMASRLEKIKADYDRGTPPNWAEVGDPHVAAGLLKMYLRELPDSLIPSKNFTKIVTRLKVNEESFDADLKKIVESIPKQNWTLLSYLMTLLKEVHSHSGKNKMTSENLGIVIGPNLVRSENLKEESYEAHGITAMVVKAMVERHDFFFGTRPPSHADVEEIVETPRQSHTRKSSITSTTSTIAETIPTQKPTPTRHTHVISLEELLFDTPPPVSTSKSFSGGQSSSKEPAILPLSADSATRPQWHDMLAAPLQPVPVQSPHSLMQSLSLHPTHSSPPLLSASTSAIGTQANPDPFGIFDDNTENLKTSHTGKTSAEISLGNPQGTPNHEAQPNHLNRTQLLQELDGDDFLLSPATIHEPQRHGQQIHGFKTSSYGLLDD